MTIDILLLEMIKRISIAIVLGLILAQTKAFDRLISHRLSQQDRLFFIFIFSSIAIAGTYAGIPIDDALANSRMVGIMAAGLIAGPLMGTSVGIVSGIHRYFLGGFTAVACAISSIVEGILAGLCHKFYPRTPAPWPVALVIGCVGELVQMGIILGVAKPYALATALVSEIAVPMTIANSLGLALFIKIIQESLSRKEALVANQSYSILSIAKQTVPYFRQGLTAQSARAIVRIIKEHSDYAAVSITDTTHILAYTGVEEDHHAPGKADHLTHVTAKALKSGKICLAHSRHEIGCDHPGCSLASAVVVPLRLGAKTIVGTLKLYYTDTSKIPGASDIAFAQGLAELFSTQLELAEIDKQTKLTEEAKLQALHTQINPHFLFNTLNTISSLIRTNPELARRLLVKFSQLFRFTLQYTGLVIPFSKEWEQVSAFLEISLARHGDKLFITTNIDPRVYNFGIPSLTLQPIIENSIKHGLQAREMGGSISIEAYPEGDDFLLAVTDDGVGFDKDPQYYLENAPKGHIGLSNVHQRLRTLYGAKYGLTITSEPEDGTCVLIRLPQVALAEVPATTEPAPLE